MNITYGHSLGSYGCYRVKVIDMPQSLWSRPIPDLPVRSGVCQGHAGRAGSQVLATLHTLTVFLCRRCLSIVLMHKSVIDTYTINQVNHGT